MRSLLAAAQGGCGHQRATNRFIYVQKPLERVSAQPKRPHGCSRACQHQILHFGRNLLSRPPGPLRRRMNPFHERPELSYTLINAYINLWSFHHCRLCAYIAERKRKLLAAFNPRLAQRIKICSFRIILELKIDTRRILWVQNVHGKLTCRWAQWMLQHTP